MDLGLVPQKANRTLNTVGNIINTHEFHGIIIPLHSLYWSIDTKDESKLGTAFTFIFGVKRTLVLWCHSIVWSLYFMK